MCNFIHFIHVLTERSRLRRYASCLSHLHLFAEGVMLSTFRLTCAVSFGSRVRAGAPSECGMDRAGKPHQFQLGRPRQDGNRLLGKLRPVANTNLRDSDGAAGTDSANPVSAKPTTWELPTWKKAKPTGQSTSPIKLQRCHPIKLPSCKGMRARAVNREGRAMRRE